MNDYLKNLEYKGTHTALALILYVLALSMSYSGVLWGIFFLLGLIFPLVYLDRLGTHYLPAAFAYRSALLWCFAQAITTALLKVIS